MKTEIIDYLNYKLGYDYFFDKIRSSDLKFVEHSAKISRTEYLDERILFAINQSSYTSSEFKSLLESLNPPSELIEKCLVEFLLCSGFGFAFEMNGDQVNNRVYFENDMTPYRERNLRKSGKTKEKTITGYKWYSTSNAYLITNYDYVLDIDYKNVMLNIKEDSLKDFLNFTLDQIKSKNVERFFIAKDINSNRKSYDLRLTKFSVKNIPSNIKEIHINDLDSKLKKYIDMNIHHITFGLDKENEVFFTIYFKL